MGRAMLIICSAVLIAIGYVSISALDQGKLLTQKTVNYADFTMAKNTAHTAIQIAMQRINKDDSWVENHSSSTPWDTTIDGREISLHVDHLNNSNTDYWVPDSLRMVSKATYFISRSGNDATEITAEVVSLYLKQPFSALVPDFGGALQFPTGFGDLTVNGAAHALNGVADHCAENKPPIVTGDQETKDKLDGNEDLNMDGEVLVDSTLNYEPTDKLIERLKNSGNATTVDSDYSGSLGTEDDPGVFFINGDVKLTGQQSEGYGIMVVQSNAYMSYDSAGTSVSIRGNFEFNGLVIFENAQLFEGGGTPTINGSVLVGHTSDNETPIDITLNGHININYDCDGENYAKMAAADAVKQNKYTRVVTTEGANFVSE